jgi:hypothetical protein
MPAQIGGYARVYHELFASLAAWQMVTLESRTPVRQPYFYASALQRGSASDRRVS